MIKTIAKILVAAVAFGGFANAQTLKIGVINMQEVLLGYYKYKQAQADLNVRTDALKKDLDVRRAKVRDLAREVEDLQKLIRDESTTQEFRRMKDQEFQTKLSEAKHLERELDNLTRTRTQQIDLESKRTLRGIGEEMKVVVEDIARKDGYDLVFDKSQLLFSKDAVDFTAAVLSELNKDAPEEFKNAPPAAAPGEKKDAPEGAPGTAEPKPADEKKPAAETKPKK